MNALPWLSRVMSLENGNGIHTALSILHSISETRKLNRFQISLNLATMAKTNVKWSWTPWAAGG
jgi:hypothetical protein